MNMEEWDNEGLIELVRRGGVFRDIEGALPKDVITNLINVLRLPPQVNRDRLLEAALEREALMPTSVGHGIALPHPRNPLISDAAMQLVAIAFLARPVDWFALDGEPVHTVLFILSASAKLHLHTLSRINFFCQQESFRNLLINRSSGEEIIRVIGDAEAAWEKTGAQTKLPDL
ncbi:MAG: PTS sugar transporter subunit IIA [Spirochaetaceae bacterium]|jgi:PTS system nitrogen regulatory IIA component|nr:PTS sugar transporter subunit IIA [Spirochaetaceae bacterium]